MTTNTTNTNTNTNTRTKTNTNTNNTTDTNAGTPSRTGPSRIPVQATRVAAPSLGPERGPSFGRLARSEWTKLRSLRSTWWSLALAALIGIGFAIGAAVSLNSGAVRSVSGEALPEDDVFTVLGTIGVIALVLGVLGALQMSSEYASGTISVSLTAVPKRRPLLVAKAAVLVAVVAPLSLAVSAGALVIGDAIIEGGLPFSWPAVLGNTAYLTAVAVLGLSLATLTRSTAAAIAVLVAMVFILPPLLPALPGNWPETIADFLPSGAQDSLIRTVPGTAPISDVAAVRTLVAWTLLPLTAGAILLTRRDA